MNSTSNGICFETTDGVIIEGMDINAFGRWIYPPSRDNWWIWAALACAGMLGLLLLMAWFAPIRGNAPTVIERIVAPMTPAPGQGVNPDGRPARKPVGL